MTILTCAGECISSTGRIYMSITYGKGLKVNLMIIESLLTGNALMRLSLRHCTIKLKDSHR